MTHCIIQSRPPRIARVAAFGSMASSHSSFQSATKYVGIAKDNVRFGNIRIEIDSPLRRPNGLPGFPGHYQHDGQRLISFRACRCKANCSLGPEPSFVECRARWTNPTAHSNMQVAKAKQSVSIGELGVNADRTFQIGDRSIHLLLGHPMVGGSSAQIAM